MGQKRHGTGLIKRGGYWHIDKQLFGQRIRGATGTKQREEAETVLARRIEETRQALIFGVRPKRLFKEAMVKYLRDYQHKDSIDSDASKLRLVAPYVADLSIDSIHMGTLQSFIADKQTMGRKSRTINHGLKIIRRILNLAAGEWIDDKGLTWLANAPKIKLLPEHDSRPPYPLSWEEEDGLLSVFVLPAFITVDGERFRLIKNGRDRLVVLNKVALEVVESVRGQHPEFVFTYRGRPMSRMNNTAWRKARGQAGLPDLHVHDLKHTYGRRLRAAGVSFEDRQDLLGHKSSRMTTHYSAAELEQLLTAANKACCKQSSSVTLELLRRCAR